VILALCLAAIISSVVSAELLQVIAIVNTGSTFFMAYEDNQVWRWGGPPQHLEQVDRGDIAIRDMKRWFTGDMVVLLYEDEQIWVADINQFWFHVDAHREGTEVLYMDSEMAPQIVCTYTDGQVWIWTDGIWRREESMERENPVSDVEAVANREGISVLATPNPSRGSVEIDFDFPTEGRVSVKIVGPTGRIVRHLLDGPHFAGDYSLIWDGLDDTGREVPAGVNLTRIETTDGVKTGRVVAAK
jgi:hypothetical protein